jgi:cell division septation protein DedD
MRPFRPTRLRRLVAGCLAATAFGVAAAGLVACGNQNGLLAANSGSSLEDRLAAVSDAVSSGDCNRAVNASADFQQQVVNLPKSVDPRLRDRLAEGGRTLAARATTACKGQTDTVTTETQTTETVTTPTVTTQTQTTPTQTQTATTPTQTTTTPSTPTTPPTTTPTPVPGGGGDSGSGGGANPIP